ncbi:family 1 glycosylhydrolase, partial [uncultured Dubosiella sp.]|uniref:family 1 glycosylhydrolase n=1 Tax=uncultured Dubosiella sp. TaxID=1937011 RepID=UPI00262E6302
AAQMADDFRNNLTFDVMVNGEFPSWYTKFLHNNGVELDLNAEDMQTIKEASKRLDYLAFSYYQSDTACAPAGCADQLDFENKMLACADRNANPYEGERMGMADRSGGAAGCAQSAVRALS